MKDLSAKIVLLTGATGGLGSLLARELLREGARLILTDLNRDALRETARELEGNAPGEILRIIAADLSRESECANLAREIEKSAPSIDLLINNAGIGHVGDFLDIPAERFEALMAINTMAPMRLTRLFLPGMLRKGGGHIVYVSSLAGVIGVSNLAAYSASKFALRGFAEAMRGDLQSRGIQVSGVYPSFTNTNFLKSPRFGVNREAAVPAFLLDDPEVVVRNIMRGIKKNRARILPSLRSRITWAANRLSPELVRRGAVYLRRRLLDGAESKGDGIIGSHMKV